MPAGFGLLSPQPAGSNRGSRTECCCKGCCSMFSVGRSVGRHECVATIPAPVFVWCENDGGRISVICPGGAAWVVGTPKRPSSEKNARARHSAFPSLPRFVVYSILVPNGSSSPSQLHVQASIGEATEEGRKKQHTTTATTNHQPPGVAVFGFGHASGRIGLMCPCACVDVVADSCVAVRRRPLLRLEWSRVG